MTDFIVRETPVNAAAFADYLPRGLALRLDRLVELFRGDSSAARTKRGAVFGVMARVVNAGLLFLTQILLARLLGAAEFGVVALATTWATTLGSLGSLGLSMTPQRFQPDYVARGDLGALYGLYRFAHVVPALGGLGLAVLAIAGLWVLGQDVDPAVRVGVLIALVALPALATMDVVEGFALANEWSDLAYGLTFVIRPLLLPLLAIAAFAGGAERAAHTVLVVFAVAAWIAAAALVYLVARRFHAAHRPSPPRYERRRWFGIALPTLLTDMTFVAMGSIDILVLSIFASTADTGIYAAATKIVGVVAFVHFGLSYASAHHYAALRDAVDDPGALRRFAVATARWTFWPSLGVAVLVALAGVPLLALFGKDFTGGAVVMPILLAALVARAFIGPSEQLLVMTDHARTVTWIYAAAAIANLLLALVLTPALGAVGVAAAQTAAGLGATLATALAARRAVGGWVHAFAARQGGDHG